MRKNLRKVLTFLAAGTMLFSSMTAFAGQSTDGMADGTAYLNINNEEWSDFEATYENAVITGDGQYTVSMTATEGQSMVQFNALEVVNGEATLGTACVLTVDEIKINGEVVELTGKSYTCSADGGGVTTRVNIYNEWNAPDETATAGDDKHLDQRVAEGSVADASACLFSSDYCNASSQSGFLVESMEVTFTVSGYGTNAGASEEEAEALSVDLNGTYFAGVAIQGPKYTFRDCWENEGTGFGTDAFNQVTKQGDTAGLESVPATISDVDIAGNGTYTVSITGIEWPSDEFDAQDYLNLLILSTSIPNTGEVTVSDITLTIDGKTISDITPTQEPGSDYIRINIQNIYSDIETVKTIGYYAVPCKDITISFTVSGFAYDAEVTETATTETSTDTEVNLISEAPAEEASSGVSPVLIIVIAVVVIAAVAAVVVVSSKKKNNK